jgi:hypothetical protein
VVTLGPVELTTRDLATAFWWAVIALAVLLGRSTRRSLGGVLGAVGRLTGPLALYVLWVGLLVLLATRIPFGDGTLWELGQLKDTVAWFAVSGLLLLFRFPKATTEPHFYVRRLIETVWGASLLQIYLGLVTFDLWVEILWPVPIVFVALLLAVPARDPGQARLQRGINVVQVLLGLALLVVVAVVLINQLPGYDWRGQLQTLALTIWLTAGALPFIAWLSLYSNYQLAFMHMRQRGGRGAPLKTKLAVITSFHVRNGELHRFAGSWPRKVAEADGFRAGRRVIREFRADLRAREAAERQKAEDLVRYAGVDGTDAQGRRLDRREFPETINTLELIAGAHAGWYKREPAGRYKATVDEVISVFARGLPDEHGIVMKVRKDGKAWYAWRRTVTGWVFAIGAKGRPPKQWFYDGPEPPRGYPDSDPAWPSAPFERGPNWEADHYSRPTA